MKTQFAANTSAPESPEGVAAAKVRCAALVISAADISLEHVLVGEAALWASAVDAQVAKPTAVATTAVTGTRRIHPPI